MHPANARPGTAAPRVSSERAATGFSYTGTELDALASARNYYDLILDYFAPFIGRRVIEVGAGIGTFAQHLLARHAPEYLLLVEPADNNAPILERRFANDPVVETRQGYVEDFLDRAIADTAIAVNVLEHVAEERPFLEALARLLVPGGHVLVFVPAMPFLFGTLDVSFEHHRRYTKDTLAAAIRSSGLEPIMLRYVNSVGMVPWLVAGRILRRRTIRASHVRFYDRFVIPWLRLIERVVEPPVGQSLIAIARVP